MKISKHIREFLLKNPPLYEGYTSFLNITTKVMVYSLDHVIKHTAIIKGINLKDPWKLAREYLEKNFDTVIKKDFSIPSYKEVIYNQLKNSNLSKEDFNKLTDLSDLDDVCKCTNCTCKSSKNKVVKKPSSNKVKKSVSKKATTKTAKGRSRIRKDLIDAAKSK